MDIYKEDPHGMLALSNFSALLASLPFVLDTDCNLILQLALWMTVLIWGFQS